MMGTLEVRVGGTLEYERSRGDIVSSKRALRSGDVCVCVCVYTSCICVETVYLCMTMNIHLLHIMSTIANLVGVQTVLSWPFLADLPSLVPLPLTQSLVEAQGPLHQCCSYHLALLQVGSV